MEWRCWYSLFLFKEFTKVVTIDGTDQKAIVVPCNFTGAEVGVYKGDNTVTLLSHIPFLKKLYCIDRWEEYDGYSKDLKYNFPNTDLTMEEIFNNFKKTIIPVIEKVEILRMDSAEAINFIPNDSLDFVFIDGNHKYEIVKRDILMYIPKVKIGGILSGHDYIRFKNEPEHRYEVKKAVDEIFSNNVNIEGTVWFTKRLG
uniref:Putative methyltransferase n=1 Tax=viral metagenome TaxID=1070528 RepID=A0A6M3K0E5_9ZZZZ